MTERGWKRPFDAPIILPNGKKLTALRDAATFITRLQPQHQLSRARLVHWLR